MTPKIYSVNVEDAGQPIKSVKRKATPKSLPASIPETGITPTETSNETKPKRIRKKANPKISESPIKNPKETLESPVSTDNKVETKVRSRTQKNIENRSNSSENLDTLIEEALSECTPTIKINKSVTPPPSEAGQVNVVKAVDDSQPPAWFKAYIQGVRSEEALISQQKIPKKVTKALANEEAVAKWKEPVTRDRVNKSIDTHMQKMYNNIFPNRRF